MKRQLKETRDGPLKETEVCRNKHVDEKGNESVKEMEGSRTAKTSEMKETERSKQGQTVEKGNGKKHVNEKEKGSKEKTKQNEKAKVSMKTPCMKGISNSRFK